MSRCRLSSSSDCSFCSILGIAYVSAAGRSRWEVICPCLDTLCVCLYAPCYVKDLLKHLCHILRNLSKGIWYYKSYSKYSYQRQGCVLPFFVMWHRK